MSNLTPEQETALQSLSDAVSACYFAGLYLSHFTPPDGSPHLMITPMERTDKGNSFPRMTDVCVLRLNEDTGQAPGF